MFLRNVPYPDVSIQINSMTFSDYIYRTTHGSSHLNILHLQEKAQQRGYKKPQLHTTLI